MVKRVNPRRYPRLNVTKALGLPCGRYQLGIWGFKCNAHWDVRVHRFWGIQDQYHIYGISAQYARYWAPQWEWFARYDWAGSTVRITTTNLIPPPTAESWIFSQSDSGVLALGFNRYYKSGEHNCKWTTDLNFTIDQTDVCFIPMLAALCRMGKMVSDGFTIAASQLLSSKSSLAPWASQVEFLFDRGAKYNLGSPGTQNFV